MLGNCTRRLLIGRSFCSDTCQRQENPENASESTRLVWSLEAVYSISNLEDWYQLRRSDVVAIETGREILRKYHDGSFFKFLEREFPNHTWLPWKFKQTPRHFWNSRKNRKMFLDWYAKENTFSGLEDWYNVEEADLRNQGGTTLLHKCYRDSIQKMVEDIYSDHSWVPWKFKHHRAWKDMRNRRDFLDSISKIIGIHTLEDWYHVDKSEVFKLGGYYLVNHYYKDSLKNALKDIYNEHTWHEWLFRERAPQGTWSDSANHRRFFDWLGERIGVSELADWYTVTVRDIALLTSVLNYYGGSLSNALKKLYPDHAWEDWKFVRAPSQYWEKADIASLRQFVQELAGKLGVELSSPTEWSRISFQQLQRSGASHIVLKYGGLNNLLTKVFPEVDWTIANFANRGKRSTQRLLRLALEEVFPNEELIEEYSDPRMRFSFSNAPMELDFYLPRLNLAIEFQGVQHYRDAINLGEFKAYRFVSSAVCLVMCVLLTCTPSTRDLEKQAAAQQLKMTLIAVPYWWDMSVTSLLNTIRKSRPDLVKEAVGDGMPIPPARPQGHKLSYASKKAEKMAELFMLPLLWEETGNLDPSGWTMISEPSDALRVIWNGTGFYAKASGRKVSTPAFLSSSLPRDVILDGWLTIKRNTSLVSTSKVLDILSRPAEVERWQSVDFMAFDIVAPGRYRERLALLTTLPGVTMVQWQPCSDLNHFESYLHDSSKNGNAGLLLINPSSPRVSGRSASMLRHRLYKQAEAKVLAVDMSRNACLLEWPNGRRVVAIVHNHPAPILEATVHVRYSQWDTEKDIPTDASVIQTPPSGIA